jgi:hypothetical protein
LGVWYRLFPGRRPQVIPADDEPASE